MENLQFDISRFLRAPDGKKMFCREAALPRVVVSDQGSSEASSPGNSMSVIILVIITLIIIAAIAYFYLKYRSGKSTKECIDQVKKTST